jgi:GNAT superfamily N-acetyltransferase
MREQGIVIRRPFTYELSFVREFIVKNFTVTWADEVAATFSNMPVSCFIAIEKTKVVGFAAIETTARGFFGPTGVAEIHRHRGIGQALLIASLWGLRELGYQYGIIGGAGPVDFYAKSVPAIVIEDSEPGIYPPSLAH